MDRSDREKVYNELKATFNVSQNLLYKYKKNCLLNPEDLHAVARDCENMDKAYEMLTSIAAAEYFFHVNPNTLRESIWEDDDYDSFESEIEEETGLEKIKYYTNLKNKEEESNNLDSEPETE